VQTPAKMTPKTPHGIIIIWTALEVILAMGLQLIGFTRCLEYRGSEEEKKGEEHEKK
jgi:hypothetical protein